MFHGLGNMQLRGGGGGQGSEVQYEAMWGQPVHLVQMSVEIGNLITSQYFVSQTTSTWLCCIMGTHAPVHVIPHCLHICLVTHSFPSVRWSSIRS